MLDALLAVASLFAYILIGTVRYRHGHIKRSLADQRGEKSPGFHGGHCEGRKNRWRYYGCEAECYKLTRLAGGVKVHAEDCRAEHPEYGACDCITPFFLAIAWFVEPFVLAVALTGRLIHRLATPEVVAPKTRLEELEERNAELERELGIS